MTIKIITDYPIAINSPDHYDPKGTRVDNMHDGSSSKFIKTIMEKFEYVNFLDLGTAGGGLVADFINAGANVAVGVDGSDYSLNLKRAEWGSIPDNLFTADITKPFYFENLKFNVISAWDVLEHIKEIDLPQLFTNIKNNLTDDGYFFCSIANWPDDPHHVTLKEKEWWLDIFDINGFVKEEIILQEEYARHASYELTFRKK